MPKESDAVIPISNLPELPDVEIPIPNEYQMEIYRLRREIETLRHAVKDKNDRIEKALEALRSELRFWQLFLYEKQSETYGQIMQRMRRLEATISLLEDLRPLGSMPEMVTRWEDKRRRRE